MFFWTKGKLAKVCSRIGSNFGYNRENVGDIEELKCWKEILSCNLGFEEPLYNLLHTKLDVIIDVMETRCMNKGWRVLQEAGRNQQEIFLHGVKATKSRFDKM